MTREAEREAARAREVFERRMRSGVDARYNPWEPVNLFNTQSRERVLLAALRGRGLLPLTGRDIIDVGCGGGSLLRDLVEYGARPEDLCGIDLVPERVDGARGVLPTARLEVGDAQSLDHADDSFDLVLAFTVLSSVVDDGARRRIAAEMVRVARPGGLILVYDFWTNPTNPDVRPLRRSGLRRLMSGRQIEFRSVTLAPPLSRVLIRAPGGWLACTALEALPFLRTHYLAAVRA